MIISHRAEETQSLGARWAEFLRPGAVVALTGDLGTGKTHFVQGLARGLGHAGAVTSPTFTLLHEYRGGRLPLFHGDFYRLASAAEALAIGLEEIWDAGGICVLEWGDKFPAILPPETRRVHFAMKSETREISGLRELE